VKTGGVRSAALDTRAYAPSLIPSRLGPERRFVVLGTGRSGSRLLLSMLRRQPRVLCDGEILSPENRIRFPFRWVQSHAMRARFRGARGWGFKLLVHHFRDLALVDGGRAFVDRLADAGYLVVVLTRNNLLRQAVSWERAQIVGRHHYKVGEEREGSAVHLDPVQLLVRMGLLELENDFARTVGKEHSHVEVCYEDDLLDAARHQATADRVMTALDMPSAPVRTPLRRGSPDDLRDQLSNWEEVADVIGRTRYADFLTD